MLRSIVVGLLAAALLAGPVQAEAPTLAPLQFANVNGAKLGYRVLNPDARGRALVMICGYGLTMAEWPPQLVEELAKKRRVVIFDNRGIGNSSGPVRGLTVDMMASDTIGLIRRLGLRRVDILGWSMGGYIAQRVAIRRPRLVRRLVLAATDPGSPRAIQASRRVTRILTTATSPNELLPILFPKSRLAAGRAWYRAIAAQPNLTAADFSTPRATMRQQTLANAGRWYGPGKGTYRHLGKIRARTLIAHGTEDVVVPPGNSRILARRIKRSTTITYRNAGHAFLAQAPRAKAHTFSRFLDGR